MKKVCKNCLLCDFHDYKFLGIAFCLYDGFIMHDVNYKCRFPNEFKPFNNDNIDKQLKGFKYG